MARVVDGKIVLGAQDGDVIDLFAEVRERNAARKKQQASQAAVQTPPAKIARTG